MDSLIIYHAQTGVEIPQALAKFPQWKTCLRSLVFVPPYADCEDFASGGLQRFDEKSMYQFLLEVICGLHSPLMGETEVQGQFREFLKIHNEASDSWIKKWNSFFQAVLFDAKEIREKYLQDLGSQSYGSLTRKMIKDRNEHLDTPCSLWGGGQLAQEIQPWLKTENLNLYNRRLIDDRYLLLNSEVLKNTHRKNEILIIAANISNQEIVDLILTSGAEYSLILDWRGDQNLRDSQLSLHLQDDQYVDFSSLMKNLDAEKNRLAEKLLPARDLISKKSQKFMQKSLSRPLGWDDLCA